MTLADHPRPNHRMTLPEDGIADDVAVTMRMAARIGLIGLSPYDLPEAARHVVSELASTVPGSSWLLTQFDPVQLIEYPLARVNDAQDGESFDLRSQDGRLTGRLVVRLPDGVDAIVHNRATPTMLAVLAGMVDWMHGPLWLTTGQAPGEYAGIVTDDATLVPIPGRDPGPHLATGSPLATSIARLRPPEHKMQRFWWRGSDSSLLRVVVTAGPQGVLVTMGEQELPYGLSVRELEVVSLIVEGLTNAQIARQLFITDSTVANHVERILRKTDSASRAVITARATFEGLAIRPLPGNRSDG